MGVFCPTRSPLSTISLEDVLYFRSSRSIWDPVYKAHSFFHVASSRTCHCIGLWIGFVTQSTGDGGQPLGLGFMVVDSKQLVREHAGDPDFGFFAHRLVGMHLDGTPHGGE